MRRTAWLIAGLGLAAAAIIIIMASPRASAWQIGDTYSGSGDWTINNPTDIGDETVTVAGNLYVNSQLTMYNARINIDSGTTDGLYTVNVASGGKLNIWGGSALSAQSGSYHYKFTVYGTLDVNQSSVSEMWGDTTWWTGGIQLYSSGSTIRGASNIYNGKTGGICIVNVTATISDSYIYSNGADGASTTYCYGILASSNGATATTISNCRIYGNTYSSGALYGYGVISNFQTSADSITNCFIYNNGGGTLAVNSGYQLYLQYSKVSISNTYLGNGSCGLYAVESSPPTITNLNINSYTYSAPTYGVWAYNSSLAFSGCSFATTYVSSTQYGVYASGPSDGSNSKLTFTSCTFTYTLASTQPRYNIYTAGGYTPVSITGCTFTDTSGSNVYCVYASSWSPVDIVTTTMTVSTTAQSSAAVYSTVFSPVNITWSSITMTNTAQAMSSASTYMVCAYNNSPVKVANCVLSMSLNPGTSTPTNPSFCMLSSANLSTITIDSSTLNIAAAATGVNPQYAAYYHIYTTDYSGASVSDSWLNFTASTLNNYPSIHTIYATIYSPVSVAASNLRTAITYTGTVTGAYFNMINGSTWSPIKVSGSSLQMTATCSAPSTAVRMLYANDNSEVSVDYTTITVSGTYSGTNDFFSLVTLTANSACFMNYSTLSLGTTSTATGHGFYAIYANNYCPVFMVNCDIAMTESVSQTGSFHYFGWGNSYSPISIANSIVNFLPSVSATSGTQYFYVFYRSSYSHLMVDDSTINIKPYMRPSTSYIYLAYPMSYSWAWVNYSFFDIAPTYISATTYLYGIGNAGSSNYGGIDVNWTTFNVTPPLVSANTFYCNYFFQVYSTSGRGSYISLNNSNFIYTAMNVNYGVYLQYLIHGYYLYNPIYMYDDNIVFNARSTSSSYPIYLWLYPAISRAAS